MGVLRIQAFMDETLLQWNIWRQVCRTTNKKLYAMIACSSCKQLRSLSMRNLHFAHNRVQRSAMVCADMGVECGIMCNDVLEFFDVPTHVPHESQALTPDIQQKSLELPAVPSEIPIHSAF